MTDDIVTRLRAVPKMVPRGMLSVTPNAYYDRCQDAAKEIEFLREQVNLWRTISERLVDNDPRYESSRDYFNSIRTMKGNSDE